MNDYCLFDTKILVASTVENKVVFCIIKVSIRLMKYLAFMKTVSTAKAKSL